MKLTASGEAQAFYLIGAGSFLVWLTYSALNIRADAAAVAAEMAKYQTRPPLSAWTEFTLRYGAWSWLLPLALFVVVAISVARGWSFRFRLAVFVATAALAIATHVALTDGVYAPVVWFMNKVL